MTELNIPKKNSQEEQTQEKLLLNPGETTIIIGANGTGKTRLAVYLEEQLGDNAHRIAAHRALILNPSVDKIPENKAQAALRYGYRSDSSNVNYRKGYRWGGNATISLLNDFDSLLQYLFAQQNNLAVRNNQKFNAGEEITESKTKLDILKDTWEFLLPHRQLHISADDINVSAHGSIDNQHYSASEMSDGERAVFYILGQVLAAKENSVLIFDEPELHIHKSILSNLWDKIEELRPDCSFLMITHDIEFASTRVAKKYVIRSYYSDPAWDISEVPESDFDEQTIAMILGSRKPILFVEGDQSSLDIAIYRACYPEWTIIPKGSCKDVIQSVSSLNQLSESMPTLNLKCAGIIDQDDRDEEEISRLNALGIFSLSVSEIENLFCLTSVAQEILKIEQHSGQELQEKLNEFKSKILTFISSNLDGDKLDKFVMEKLKIKIDSYLKKVDLSRARNSEEVTSILNENIEVLKTQYVEQWVSEIRDNIQNLLQNSDLDSLLKLYNNKGLLAEAASILKGSRKDHFESWIMRQMKNKESSLIRIIKENLPDLRTS
ncbi:AAA family ATPase [Bibersteinia trehalosi]|uniref:DUF4435 domain-containing protein n=1 Tax=Bibersteinia trehalosi TaxID=47735 RepID=A0A426FGQ2_BIBTR|nr:AAA family ATPase [Bibersteinia trehalosi]RRN02377.1 DUF4435 domain-containing protein [Bibersteinia trehalosi]